MLGLALVLDARLGEILVTDVRRRADNGADRIDRLFGLVVKRLELRTVGLTANAVPCVERIRIFRNRRVDECGGALAVIVRRHLAANLVERRDVTALIVARGITGFRHIVRQRRNRARDVGVRPVRIVQVGIVFADLGEGVVPLADDCILAFAVFSLAFAVFAELDFDLFFAFGKD